MYVLTLCRYSNTFNHFRKASGAKKFVMKFKNSSKYSSKKNSSKKIVEKNPSQKSVEKNPSKNPSKKFTKKFVKKLYTYHRYTKSNKKETETYKKNQSKRTEAKEPRLQQQQNKSRFLEASLVRQADSKLKNTQIFFRNKRKSCK